MNKIFYFVGLLLVFTFKISSQQDTIIYNPSTGNYTIHYVGEDTTVTLTYIPWTKLNPFVNCEVLYDIDSSEYIYNWTIGNGEDSEQNLKVLVIVFGENSTVVDRSTLAWHSGRWKSSVDGEVVFLNMWDWFADQGLEPTWSVSGLKLGSPDLPSIGFAYFQGKGSIPRFPYGPPPEKIDTQFAKLDGFPGNYVQRVTIVPDELPDPFIPLNFLDTLLNYNQRSFELNWVANQATTDKYESLFTSAKTQLQQNNNNTARATLQTVLQEVDIDSTDNLTSEAYALLRYNTEYLLTKIQAFLEISVITPAMSLVKPGAFTMEVKGSGFTSSSVVYFNGNARATAYLSDSILTAQILASDVTAKGRFAVWVRDGSKDTDTVMFTVVDKLANKVTPIFNCVKNNGDGTYTAYFGYNNLNSVSVYIPIGKKNKFDPKPEDRGQTRVFLPGVRERAVTINFNGKKLSWTIDGSIASGDRNSESCP
jgi:hypothetical protein